MKVFEVEWNISGQNNFGLQTYPPFSNSVSKKVFGTREKAEELYKRLYDAANLLGIGSLIAKIHEVELE